MLFANGKGVKVKSQCNFKKEMQVYLLAYLNL